MAETHDIEQQVEDPNEEIIDGADMEHPVEENSQDPGTQRKTIEFQDEPSDEEFLDTGDTSSEEETQDIGVEGDDTTEGEEPEFYPELLEAAGLTLEEARDGFGTPQALAAAIRMLDSRHIQAGAQALQQNPDEQTLESELSEDKGDDEFVLPPPSDGGEWNEDTKLLVKALNERHRSELKRRDEILRRQEEQLKQITNSQKQREVESYVAEFDGFIDALGKEWQGIFGKGPGSQLAPGSMAIQNRIHLDNVARQLAAGRERYGQPPLSTAELRVRALRVAFPEKHEKQVEKEVTEKVAKRNRMLTARPTQRRGKPLTGESLAAKNVEEFWKKHGLSVMEDDFEYDTI